MSTMHVTCFLYQMIVIKHGRLFFKNSSFFKKLQCGILSGPETGRSFRATFWFVFTKPRPTASGPMVPWITKLRSSVPCTFFEHRRLTPWLLQCRYVWSTNGETPIQGREFFSSDWKEFLKSIYIWALASTEWFVPSPPLRDHWFNFTYGMVSLERSLLWDVAQAGNEVGITAINKARRRTR